MYNEDLAAIGIAAVVMFLVIIALVRGLNELMVPGELAKVEQLRKDVRNVPSGSNEDVLGQVTELNQRIQSAKRYRKLWWGRVFTPEEWDGVALIEIPSHQLRTPPNP